MKIITRRNSIKLAKELTNQFKIIFRSKGITLKEKDIITIENNFLKALGGQKNERKNKYYNR